MTRLSLRICGVALALVLAGVACNGTDDGGTADPKTEYETIIGNLKEPVGVIAAFQPYLQRPEDKGEYVPQRRADEVKASFYAANEIRHACNRARQSWGRKRSALATEIVELFIKVNKVCADPEEMPDVAKCEAEVKALDASLQAHGEKASAAGASGKMPRINPAAVTPTAKIMVERFQRALGPTKQETKYLQMRSDENVKAFDLIAECQGSASTADEVMKAFEKEGDPELRKLAAIHKLALDAQCRKLSLADGLLQVILQCVELAKQPPKPKTKKEEEEEGDDPCKRACAQTETLMARGIPAKVFARIEEDHKEACKKDEDEKKKRNAAETSQRRRCNRPLTAVQLALDLWRRKRVIILLCLPA